MGRMDQNGRWLLNILLSFTHFGISMEQAESTPLLEKPSHLILEILPAPEIPLHQKSPTIYGKP